MTAVRISRELLPILLAAALFLTAAVPAGAEEVPDTGITETLAPTIPPETSAPTVPPETSAPTIPPETSAPTVPPETSAPTLPPETSVPTVPPETSTPTVPQETSDPTTPPETTQPPETTETEPPADSLLFMMPPPIVTTIADAWAMAAGTENITIQGTVVYLGSNQAVLQDDTGGIRLSFPASCEDLALGDVLLVTGNRSGGFSVTDYEWQGTAELPALESTLLEAPENVRVCVRNAVLSYGMLKQDSFSMSVDARLPDTVRNGDAVTAYGVILDGCFYADTVQLYEPEPEEGQQEWNLYFGQLHAHTSISDGMGSVTDAFAHAAAVEGLDFFAVTDHSDSFDNGAFGAIGTEGSTVSEEWKTGKAAAAAVTDDTFVGLFGYEMSWGEDLALGHINTFNTPGWQTSEQPGFATLESYYEALTTVPGSISQFNHPGLTFGDFEVFGNYSPEYDEVIQLLEVGSGNAGQACDQYTKALDKGWHVAPTNNQNNHFGNWGSENSGRTVVLAKQLTEASLYEAMRSHRVYATEDSDLSILYKLNGRIMGSILSTEDQLTVSAAISDPTDAAIGTVEVIADGGIIAASQTVNTSAADLTMTVSAGYRYYYLRITQPDGDMAVTAPVWVDNFENMGIRSFAADPAVPRQGEDVQIRLELFNQEKRAFVIDSIRFTHNGTVLHEMTDPGTVNALGELTYSVPFTWPDPGEVQLVAVVTGTVVGQSRTYEKTLTLWFQPTEEILSTIADARAGQLGAACRVSGYVTAGNAVAHNSFPNTLYLQDDTGGIAVTGFAGENIQVGTPMEVTGCLRNAEGNLVLELTDCAFPEGNLYRYVPRTMTHAVATDYAAHGGELLQIEGEVVSLTKTADGKGISRMTLKDIRGDLATVMIEDNIGSLAYGTNELAADIRKGRTVRAMGLLHVDEYGAVVLRVRNCEEVVYIPPVADTTNPKTGDGGYFIP